MIVQETSRRLHTLLTSDQLLNALVLCGAHISNVMSTTWNKYKHVVPDLSQVGTKDMRVWQRWSQNWSGIHSNSVVSQQDKTMMWKAVNNQIAVHIPDHIDRPTEQSRGHHPVPISMWVARQMATNSASTSGPSAAGIYFQNLTSWQRVLTVLKLPSGNQ